MGAAEKQKAEQESSSNNKQNEQKMINTGPSMLSKADIQRIKAMKMKMAINNAVNKVLQEEEAKIDRKLEKLSNMDEDDLEELRAKRLEDLKKNKRNVANGWQ